MIGKAFAPEYQGALSELSVNTALVDVLVAARERERAAERDGDAAELGRSRLALGEACRRLGRLDQAESAWKSSYRIARGTGDRSAMAWALWSGGTLARQRGNLDLAVRWLAAGRDLAQEAGDSTAFGYAFAGIAETLRIRGDHEQARELHHYVLAHARERNESRHVVWALEGIAQIDRHTGDLDSAWERFEEASRIAADSGDERGHAWALRGLADVGSLRGEHQDALSLLSRAERVCREMDLSSALAYNRKMRGNVLLRAGWHDEAARAYRDAREKFRAIREPRGEALATLGLIKSLDRGGGRSRSETVRELVELRDSLQEGQLRHTRRMVEDALRDLVPERTGAVSAP
ncbi:tetratricopeptide repeat protein [Parasphingorhabdus pacifica]